MKKIQLALAGIVVLLASCNNATQPAATTETAAVSGSTMSAKAQKNLDAMHVIDKAFQTGDVSGVDSVVAANFVDHTDKGEMNRDSLKSMIKWSSSDKTMKMETVKELADDDYAMAVMHMTGTGDGVMMPAGPYDMHSVEVVKFADGKAIEHWSYMEMGEVAKMMASMPGGKMPDKEKKK